MNHISYCVSYSSLVEKWIEENHMNDHIVIVYDPLTHIDLLRGMEIEVDETNLFSSKIMIIFFVNIEESIELFNRFSKHEGPYVQAWSLGCLMRENY